MKRYTVRILLFLLFAASALAQIGISGVADEATYSDQVSFPIEHEAGYVYDARFDGDSEPVGSALQVADVDYHERLVLRTNATTMAAESRRVQFVTRSETTPRPGSPRMSRIHFLGMRPLRSSKIQGSRDDTRGRMRW